MDEKTRSIVRAAIIEMVETTASDASIQKRFRQHEDKIHFVPVKYRVFGGLLQSLNIKFGNFIERLINVIVENDQRVEALPESGRRIRLKMTSQTDSLIDRYITYRQLPDSPDQCDDEFRELLDEIISIETSSDATKQTITKDIDALFRANDGRIVYLEIKYNDDHDTGKFVDINRKFIKTFAGVVNHYKVTSVSEISPLIYYFNPLKRWGPVYTPSSNILRGSQLFDQYFDMDFQSVDRYLRELGDDDEVIKIFDDLYRTVRYET